jgi:preprotein translocase subunit YajC
MGSQISVAPKGAQTSPNPIISFMPMIVIIGILYLLIIRPQQKQAKEHRKMVEALKPGDRVLTQGGIYGTVATVRGQIIILKVADNVRIEMSRSSIVQVVQEPTETGSSEVVG